MCAPTSAVRALVDAIAVPTGSRRPLEADRLADTLEALGTELLTAPEIAKRSGWGLDAVDDLVALGLIRQHKHRFFYRPDTPPQDLVRDSAEPIVLLTVGQVARALGVGVRTVWRWVETGLLPTPVRLSAKATRWRTGDIREFLDSLQATPPVLPSPPPPPVSSVCRYCEQRPPCDDAEGLGLCDRCRQSSEISRLYRPRAQRRRQTSA